MLQTAPIQVVQISDNHLFANPTQKMMGFTTADSLRVVLETIRQLRLDPDLFLVTGDLSHDETPASYQNLQDFLLPFETPVYWIPGNHDDLSVVDSILRTPPISREKTFTVQNWQFILLNSQYPGKVYGELTSKSLENLDFQLTQHPNQPTLIALHHPPVEINSQWMDNIRLRNAEDLFTVLDRHSQVKVVIFGHIHQVFETTRNGVRYLGCPSTCVQFQPEATELTLDDIATPGFRVLTLYPNGEYDTKIYRTNYQLPAYPDTQTLRAMRAKSTRR
ncbi:MAG: 3',5'-cyclic-AMP phosphodiesterase [Cyanobacteriota bacterium]|nr:3',5'-cyclic-AMP phosphodiesterase [Cyanobacteriota bacterium]